MENLPEGDSQVQQPNARDRAAHPSGSDDGLQCVGARLPRCVQKKIIVAPVAEAERALRNPRQERKHNANLEAENDIKDYA